MNLGLILQIVGIGIGVLLFGSGLFISFKTDKSTVFSYSKYFFQIFKKEDYINPIDIQPSSKTINFSPDGNNWDEDFFIYLKNNTIYTYYNICIFSEFPDAINVDIFPEDSGEDSSIVSKKAGINVGSDFSLSGVHNGAGTKWTQTVINNIGPNITKKIRINVKKGVYKKNLNLEFKINNFSREPKPILNNGSSVGQIFELCNTPKDSTSK